MDFDKIENLEEEQLNDMLNFYDDVHLAGCCCSGGEWINNAMTRTECRSWCKEVGQACSSWHRSIDFQLYCRFRC